MESQNKKILNHLQTHKTGITSMEAFRKYGITRLSARISNLRDMDFNIKTTIETKRNDEGNVVNYARYTLE